MIIALPVGIGEYWDDKQRVEPLASAILSETKLVVAPRKVHKAFGGKASYYEYSIDLTSFFHT